MNGKTYIVVVTVVYGSLLSPTESNTKTNDTSSTTTMTMKVPTPATIHSYTSLSLDEERIFDVNFETNESSTREGYPAASPAFDNNIGPVAHESENVTVCSHTNIEFEPWWYVNIEDLYIIYHVVLYNRETYPYRLEGAQVRVGTSKHNLKNNTACGPPVSRDEASVPAGNITLRCEPGTVGNIVSVQLENKTQYLTLCEVKLYGTIYTDTCVAQDVIKNNIVYSFPDTHLGIKADSEQICPDTSRPLATRKCIGDLVSRAMWGQLEHADCNIGTQEHFKILKDVNVTDDNAAGIASALANITSDSYISEEDINIATAILEDIVELKLTDESVTTDVVSIVNNIIDVYDAEKNPTSETAISLVTSLELQLTTLAAAGMNFSSLEHNVGASTIVISSQNLVSGIGFAVVSTDDHGNEKYDFGDFKHIFEVEIPVNTTAVSIFLPHEIVPIIQNETGEDEIRLIFLVFQDSTLFVSNRLASIGSGLGFTRRVGSHICSASVVGVNNIDGLEYPVKTAFLPTEKTTDNSECVFWDVALNVSEGLWSNEGCTINGTKDGRVICLCDHLTAFSILVDFYEPELSAFQEVLTVISMVGCILSIICLIMTIATFVFIKPKSVVMKRPQKILINMSVSLILLYIVFVIGIEKTASRKVCIGVAALLHFFVIASVCWMSIEAVNLYLMFVKVFQDNVRYFMLKVSLLAYGTPLIIVSVFLGSDVKNYENEKYCFIRPGKVRSFGLMLMVGLLFLFNGIMFSLVMYKLIFGRRITRSSNQRMRNRVMKGIYNGVALSILLGLTWLFGYLAIDRESYSRKVFQALFCVFNSLQGLFIFTLFCVRQKDIRDWWKACCNHGGNNRGGAALTQIQMKTNTQTE